MKNSIHAIKTLFAILSFILFSQTVVAQDFTVTVEQSLRQSDPTFIDSAIFTVTFGESIASSFTNTSITLAGTTGTVQTDPTEIYPNDGTTFEFIVTGILIDEIVTATMAPGLVSNIGLTDTNLTSTSIDNSVTIKSKVDFECANPNHTEVILMDNVTTFDVNDYSAFQQKTNIIASITDFAALNVAQIGHHFRGTASGALIKTFMRNNEIDVNPNSINGYDYPYTSITVKIDYRMSFRSDAGASLNIGIFFEQNGVVRPIGVQTVTNTSWVRNRIVNISIGTLISTGIDLNDPSPIRFGYRIQNSTSLATIFSRRTGQFDNVTLTLNYSCQTVSFMRHGKHFENKKEQRIRF